MLALLLVGCEPDADVENKDTYNNQMSFTSIGKRNSGNQSDRDISEVPDTVGVFVKKTNTGTNVSEFIMNNAFYRITNYKSNNYLSTGGTVNNWKEGDPVPSGDQLFWYKTSHSAAYWDKNPDVNYDFYAYAPAVETNGENDYYKIDGNGKVNFKINEKTGIPVDFIYARRTNRTIAQSDSLHLPFRHMLTKLVFKLKNTTENAITCYGVKYKIKYPIASFDLVTGKWDFGANTDSLEVKRYAQYEIFSKTEVVLPELTTLLFPTNTTELTSAPPTEVVVNFQVCLNNKWYDMTKKLNDLSLQYTEGKLIELTFNCNLDYGSHHGIDEHWNIFVATFDSFEEGGSITGTLK